LSAISVKYQCCSVIGTHCSSSQRDLVCQSWGRCGWIFLPTRQRSG